MFLLQRPSRVFGPAALPALSALARAFDPKIVVAPALGGARNLADLGGHFPLSGDARITQRGIEFPGVNGLMNLSNINPVSTTSRSLLLITRLAVSPSAYPPVGSMSVSGDGRVTTVFFGPVGGSYEGLCIGRYNGSEGRAYSFPAGLPAYGAPISACYTEDGTTCACHINGADRSSNYVLPGFSVITGDAMLGQYGGSNQTSPYNGTTALWAVFGKPFDKPTARLLSENPWLIFDAPPRRIVLGAAAGGPGADLAGSADGSASGTAQLSTSIPIVGAATTVALGSGALTSQIRLSGAAAAVGVANGVLTAQIRLSGAALAQVAASGALAGSAAQLSGSATGAASGSGSLSTGIPLSATAGATAGASAQVTTSIRLSAAALMQALASGGLTAGGSGLGGAAQASASGSGSLTTAIKLIGSASAISIAAGGLTTGIKLSGAAAGVCSATGTLLVSIGLSADAAAQAGAAGTLSTQIRLSAQALMQALATASLSGPGAVLLSDPAYLVRRSRRDHGARRSRREYLTRSARGRA